jgi:hypothetical protein
MGIPYRSITNWAIVRLCCSAMGNPQSSSALESTPKSANSSLGIAGFGLSSRQPPPARLHYFTSWTNQSSCWPSERSWLHPTSPLQRPILPWSSPFCQNSSEFLLFLASGLRFRRVDSQVNDRSHGIRLAQSEIVCSLFQGFSCINSMDQSPLSILFPSFFPNSIEASNLLLERSSLSDPFFYLVSLHQKWLHLSTAAPVGMVHLILSITQGAQRATTTRSAGAVQLNLESARPAAMRNRPRFYLKT